MLLSVHHNISNKANQDVASIYTEMVYAKLEHTLYMWHIIAPVNIKIIILDTCIN